MAGKQGEEQRVPNGHGYCWDRNPDGPGRCTLPAGHKPGSGGDDHLDPYSGRSWSAH